MNIAFAICYDEDNLEKEVAKYTEKEKEDITTEDVIEYLNRNIKPARTMSESFQIEGGDTDGWFVQGILSAS
jgi:hypothetical protein